MLKNYYQNCYWYQQYMALLFVRREESLSLCWSAKAATTAFSWILTNWTESGILDVKVLVLGITNKCLVLLTTFLLFIL